MTFLKHWCSLVRAAWARRPFFSIMRQASAFFIFQWIILRSLTFPSMISSEPFFWKDTKASLSMKCILLQTGAFTSRRSAMTFHAIRYGRAIHLRSCCGAGWAISLVALSRFRCRFSPFENSLPSKQARTIQPATLSRQMFPCPWLLHQSFLRHFSAISKEVLVHFMHSRDLKSE